MFSSITLGKYSPSPPDLFRYFRGNFLLSTRSFPLPWRKYPPLLASSASLEEIFLLFTKSLLLPWGIYSSSPLGIFHFPEGNIPPAHHFSSTTLGEIFLLSDRSLPLPGEIFFLFTRDLPLPRGKSSSSLLSLFCFLLFTTSLPLSKGKYFSSPLGLFRYPGGNIPPVHQVSSATWKEIPPLR